MIYNTDLAFIISVFLTNKDIFNLNQVNKEWNYLLQEVCRSRIIYLMERAIKEDIPNFSLKNIFRNLGTESVFILFKARHLSKLDKSEYYCSEDTDNFRRFPYMTIFTCVDFPFKGSHHLFLSKEEAEYANQLVIMDTSYVSVDIEQHTMEYIHAKGYCMLKIIFYEEGSRFKMRNCSKNYICHKDTITYVSSSAKLYNLKKK